MENKGFIESSRILINSRKDILFAVTWTAALSSIISGKGVPPVSESLMSIVAVLMIVLSVYIYNDIVDREMDAYSEQDKKKGRPLAHGLVSINNAMKLVYLSGIIGLGLCFLLGRIVFIIGFTYYSLVFLYSYPKVRFKTKYIIKNLVTSLLMPTAFLISGASVEQRVSQSIFLLASTYYLMTVLLIPSIADMLDYDEDIAFNVKTLGNSLNWTQNLILYNFGIMVLIVGNLMLYYWYGTNVYSTLITCVIGFGLMGYSYKLRNEQGQEASYKLRPVSYGVILLHPLILAIGAIF